MNKIIDILNKLNTKNEIHLFLNELLTQKEINTLSKRWRIMEMLSQGIPQREISQNLNVSLCKITRGSKIIKNNNAITTKYLIKEKKNDNWF